MKCNDTRKIKKIYTLTDVANGECFEYRNNIYMKSDKFVGTEDNFITRWCINIYTGCLEQLKRSIPVTPVNAHCTIEEVSSKSVINTDSNTKTGSEQLTLNDVLSVIDSETVIAIVDGKKCYRYCGFCDITDFKLIGWADSTVTGIRMFEDEEYDTHRIQIEVQEELS